MAKPKNKFLTRIQNPKRLLLICFVLTIVSEIIFLSVRNPPSFFRRENSPVIQWHAWTPEVFVKAKQENKNVFLNIGYPTCYFCQRMHADVFQNRSVIAALNQDFISVEVDRNLFPEVDQFYMEFVQRRFGQAGWPLSLVLTDEGAPIVGGVNYPKKDLIRLLHAVRSTPPPQPSSANDRPIDMEKFPIALLKEYDAVLERNFDFFYGGFGHFPKFPPTGHLQWLLYGLKTSPSQNAEQRLRMVNTTLLGMIRGGLFDHVDGGFFRYSLDSKWQVPSFEKTLYDQALLASVYTEAFLLTQNKIYAKVAQRTLDFAINHLAGPSGAFFTGFNSQAQGTEGDYYLFRPKDIEPYQAVFFIHHPTHFASPSGLLFIKETQFFLNPDYDHAVQRLISTRANQPAPFRDENILTSWNGLMLGALAQAAGTFKQPRYLKAALANAEFLHKNFWVNGELIRGQNGPHLQNSASLEDYVFLIHGLLHLYKASGSTRWRNWAMDLQKQQDERFWDSAQGGYFLTPADAPLLPVRPKVFVDETKPAANGLAASNLVRLHQIYRDPKFLKMAKALLAAGAEPMQRSPLATPQCYLATAMVRDAESK